MAEKYFNKFKTVTYSNNKVVDITQRVVFTDSTLANPYVFYRYDLDQYERPDQFANRYYNDSYYSWLLYMANKVTDPYYEWYLTEDQFSEFIKKKYGSIEAAVSKTTFYRNNWYNSDPITVSEYEALPAVLISYWEPQRGVGGNIIGYKRKEEDIVINTNNLRSYTVSNTHFIKDEIVYVHFDGGKTGRGQVVFSSNNELVLQHTSGYTISNSTVSIAANSYVYGTESGVNTVFTTATVAANNLSEDEEVYYVPVSYLEYENEKNEQHKSIEVLDQPYAKKVANNLKDLLK